MIYKILLRKRSSFRLLIFTMDSASKSNYLNQCNLFRRYNYIEDNKGLNRSKFKSFTKDVSINSSYRDQHLQSPIRIDMRWLFGLCIALDNKMDAILDQRLKWNGLERYIFKIPKGIRGYVRHLADNTKWNCSVMNQNLQIHSESLYHLILRQSENGMATTKWCRNNLNASLLSINKSIRNYMPSLMTEFESNAFSMSNDMMRSYTYMVNFVDLRTNMTILKDNLETSWKLCNSGVPGYYCCLYSSEFMILINDVEESMIQKFSSISHKDSSWMKVFYISAKLESKKWFLFDYDQVKGLTDTISSRVLCHIYDDNLNSDIPSKIGHETLKKVFGILDDCLELKANDAYKEIKNLEPICHALIIQKSDTLQREVSFLKFLVEDLKSNNYYHMLKLYILLAKLPIEQIIEIHGLYRLWMHPTVDEEEGCKKVQDIILNQKPCNPLTIDKIMGCIKKQYCRRFIEMNGRWPSIDHSGLDDNSLLKKAITEHALSLNLPAIAIKLTEWEKIKIVNEEIFNFYTDYTELLTDRSMAPLKREVFSVYDQEIMHSGHKVSRTTSRRVLHEVLQRDQIDVKGICETIMNGDVPHDWRIVLVSAKERELKTEPRLFAMMVLEMRLYFCVTEQNISKTIFKYYPQQSMTQDEAKLTYRLFDMASVQGSGDYLDITCGIDFKSWNLHWTHESTSKLWEFFDEIFNTPGLYSYTHEFFLTSDIFLASRFNPPSVTYDEDGGLIHGDRRSWNFHNGGFEGLRQKGWTANTIGLLLLVLENTGVDCKIIGQGDNQVLKMRLPAKGLVDMGREEWIKANNNEINTQIDKVIKEISKISTDINLIVKETESWISDSVLIYGKEMWINGVQPSQALKRIVRCLVDVNEIFPTLQDKAATIQTAGQSTAKKTHVMAVPYAVCQLETLMMYARDLPPMKRNWKLTLDETFLKDINLDKWNCDSDFMDFMLRTSVDIFNNPVMSLTQYLIRGFPDPLTQYTTDLWHRSTKHNDLWSKRILFWLENRMYKIGNGNLELIVANPASINIHSGISASTSLKPLLKEHLRETTQNIHLSEVFGLETQTFSDQLHKYISTWVPFNPRVAHEVVRQTLAGTAQSFLGRFETTQTIQKSTGVYSSKELKDKVNFSDNEFFIILYITYLSIKDVSIKEQWVPMCPTKLSDDLRNFTWKKSINNNKVEGVTVPHPLHSINFDPQSQVVYEIADKMEKIVFITDDDDIDKSYIYERGIRPVLIGNSTREKRKGKIFSVVHPSRPFDSALRIVELASWVCPDNSPLQNYLFSLTKSRTDLELDILKDVSGRVISETSFAHRINDSITPQMVMHNSVANLTTSIMFCTDELGKYSKGQDNYNIHFQSIIFYCFRMMLIHLNDNKTLPIRMNASFKNEKCCMERINDDKIDTSYHGLQAATPVYTHNPLVYSSVASMAWGEIPKRKIAESAKNVDTETAAALYLLGRLAASLNTKTWLSNNLTKPPTSLLSVSDIMKMGLIKILRQLARYIIVYCEQDTPNLLHRTSGLPREFWGGITECMLFSEIQAEVISIMDIDGIGEPFSNKGTMHSILTSMLHIQIEKEWEKMNLGKWTMPYAVMKGLPLSRALRMWSYSNVMQSYYNLSTHFNICRTVIKMMKTSCLDQEVMKSVSQIIDMYSEYSYLTVIKNNPFTLIDSGPEMHMKHKHSVSAIAGNYTFLKFQEYIDINTEMKKWSSDNYFVHEIIAPQVNQNQQWKRFENESILIPDEDKYRERNRLDHQYRLYGTVSTAFYKYLEIILNSLSYLPYLPAICTCDGSGSVTRMMHLLTQKTPVWNSLCNRKELESARIPYWVPGSYYGTGVRPLGCDIAIDYGGDITDDRYLKELYKILPSKSSVVTMDAEVSSSFKPDMILQLMRSGVIISQMTDTKAYIWKTYVNDHSVWPVVCATLSRYFKSVELVVPTYSTYEGNESFFVCKQITQYTWNGYYEYEDNLAINTQIVTKYLPKRASHRESPLQSIMPYHTALLQQYAQLLGFKSNFTRSVSKFVLCPGFHITNIKELVPALIRLKEEKSHLVEIEIMSIVKANLSSKFSMADKLANLSTNVMHKCLDIPLKTIRQIDVLLATMNIKDDSIKLETAYKIITMNSVVTKNNSNLYTHPKEDITQWKQLHLRDYWRIIGHWNAGM